MRQLIIVRKDLHMSVGKLAAQVSHASMAFLTQIIKKSSFPIYEGETFTAYTEDPMTGKKDICCYRHPDLMKFSEDAFNRDEKYFTVRPVDPKNPYGHLELCKKKITEYKTKFTIDKDTYEQWISGIFTKTICEAKNKNQLMKATAIAEELGLKEGIDFFLIRDNCLTELKPEEFDEEGIGRTLTCIGFKPLPDDISHLISKKFQLYKE